MTIKLFIDNVTVKEFVWWYSYSYNDDIHVVKKLSNATSELCLLRTPSVSKYEININI